MFVWIHGGSPQTIEGSPANLLPAGEHKDAQGRRGEPQISGPNELHDAVEIWQDIQPER